MARFWVEFINRGTIESASSVDASTPIRAATQAAGQEVSFRRNEDMWIKVTPAGAQHSYGFVKA